MESIPLEEPTRPLRLKHLLTDLYHHRHSPQTPTVSALLFYFPTPTELVGPNKPGLCPLLSWQETEPEGRPISRGRAETKMEHQGLCDQRKGKEFTPATTGVEYKIHELT